MANTSLPKKLNITSWIMQGLVAIVFIAMGAIPKLTGQYMPEQIFEQVGLGSAGMYATGVAELAVGILILLPKTNWIGAALGVLVMLGAIGSHLFTDLGISPVFINPETQAEEPMPILFPMALLMMGLCLGVFALRKLHPASAGDSAAVIEADAPAPDAE